MREKRQRNRLSVVHVIGRCWYGVTVLVVSLLAATPPTMEGRGDYWEGVAQPATPLSCLADTKGLELAAPAGQGNFTAEHVIARGKMIKNLRAIAMDRRLVEGKK
jgi:hypothetical protein